MAPWPQCCTTVGLVCSRSAARPGSRKVPCYLLPPPAAGEFLMVTWVIRKAAESQQAAAEATKRIAALRTSASRKAWQPY